LHLLSSVNNASAFAKRVGAQLNIFLKAETASVKGDTAISEDTSLSSLSFEAASLKHDKTRLAAASKTPSVCVFDSQFAYYVITLHEKIYRS
jgi:hypothetical protein